MFKKILIANRGEIAVRIIRACREMDIETVAVYSEADKEALHVMLADEAVCIGPAKSKDSYLNMQNIISATVLTGATAIHPGFGFLSENSSFARMCEDCNITFIGPKADTIDLLGNKSKAKETMKNAGVPVIPGSDGEVETAKEALELANKIGYPVMLKASAGGGGKGMRAVYNPEDLEKLFTSAKAEAKAAFGDDKLYMEKLIINPKHIEVQILADSYGNVVHLGERDCSVQRRNQKMMEESPSAVMSPELRDKMGMAAVRAAQATGYVNAGTIEFLLDRDGNYYFMEMNTRIQVEHPVTEMVTGIDMIKEQLRIASGERMPYRQEDIIFKGHAIECRINAEDPSKGFMPCPGRVENVLFPGGFGVRVDSALYPGYVIPPCYDSMLAKVIAYGRDRDEAIQRMKRALSELIIDGIQTNIEYQYELLEREEIITGNYHTGLIEGK
ncbi:acetyl-CoA carboxylase biotin carboxylase subunit [Lachnospiraceae bacterium MD1]|uniref:Biotin carboxylase n=1 Tax=Variimorphobacter saccharofermentans TaxID=2755051 RepID=A0A839JYH6_9FIRM|nr:acetyl-CoA carboxylase biotin carboxylase subunit [Variimorphobacter saccharofermentans]MBB2182267.1 acetyl-CoA carboxylase biotin carboxylase subunit [Variimorphobacter saccharofermentans]